MSAAEWVYRLLLRAYPAEFRAAYGREMVLIFRDRRRVTARGIRFWWEMAWDVARSAPAQRLDAFRIGGEGDIQVREGKMRTMAILTVLIGGAEAANALIEGWAGGIANGSGFWLAGVILTVVAGALLLVAGIAMLRRSPGAVQWAQAAAVACLTVVVLVRLVHGWMSIFGTILGIVFPIALLLYLRRTRGRGSSAPTMA